MNTEQINDLLSDYSCFVGTFPRDLLPKIVKTKPCALIVNTDDSSKPGQHWIAIFITKDNTAEYFDSLGKNIIHSDIVNFFIRNKIKNVVFNSNQLQSIISDTCGAYCVLFVKFRCSNLSFGDVINYFSDNKMNNDMKAYLSLLL